VGEKVERFWIEEVGLDRGARCGRMPCWLETASTVCYLLGRVGAPGWLGLPDHGALVGWVHSLYKMHPCVVYTFIVFIYI
jgi:hypothetical protein